MLVKIFDKCYFTAKLVVVISGETFFGKKTLRYVSERGVETQRYVAHRGVDSLNFRSSYTALKRHSNP
jgi:hypothetical protein